MKSRILKILKAETGVVSGETLSARLNISRVSVWKHIRKLKEVGYHIDATPKGYVLVSTPDVLHPWEFEDREANIHYFDTVDSTMDIARDLARKGCPHFTVVVADRQKKGRGRLKRTWHSTEGGLYFTVILRPKIPPALSAKFNFAASMILARTLRSVYLIDAMVKWPNDILVDEKKISGILSEMTAETDRIDYMNIGVGINVNNDPTSQETEATSLKKILGREVSRKDLLKAFLDHFETLLNDSDLGNVVSQWKKYTETLNRHVRIVTTHDVSEGLAVDVDANGALILKLEDGSMKKILYGDCFHTKGNG